MADSSCIKPSFADTYAPNLGDVGSYSMTSLVLFQLRRRMWFKRFLRKKNWSPPLSLDVSPRLWNHDIRTLICSLTKRKEAIPEVRVNTTSRSIPDSVCFWSPMLRIASSTMICGDIGVWTSARKDVDCVTSVCATYASHSEHLLCILCLFHTFMRRTSA